MKNNIYKFNGNLIINNLETRITNYEKFFSARLKRKDDMIVMCNGLELGIVDRIYIDSDSSASFEIAYNGDSPVLDMLNKESEFTIIIDKNKIYANTDTSNRCDRCIHWNKRSEDIGICDIKQDVTLRYNLCAKYKSHHDKSDELTCKMCSYYSAETHDVGVCMKTSNIVDSLELCHVSEIKRVDKTIPKYFDIGQAVKYLNEGKKVKWVDMPDDAYLQLLVPSDKSEINTPVILLYSRSAVAPWSISNHALFTQYELVE